MTDRESDSFIREVTEEVRRDQLFRYWRRYGVLIISLVIAAVGGAAYWTWQQNEAREAAKGLGGSFIEALQTETPSEAFAELADTLDGEAATLARMNAAAILARDGDEAGALSAYVSIAGDASVPEIYGHAAAIAAARLAVDMPRADRVGLLDAATAPGAPYRLIALETRGAILIAAGETEAGWADLRQVVNDPVATRGSVLRATQLLLASGGSVE